MRAPNSLDGRPSGAQSTRSFYRRLYRSGGMSDDGKQKRRGGKSRQRTKRRTTALLRDAPPKTPLPRHRLPTINHEKLDAYLAAVEKFVDNRNRDLADLRKSRAKLEEIVHLLKTGTDPAGI